MGTGSGLGAENTVGCHKCRRTERLWLNGTSTRRDSGAAYLTGPLFYGLLNVTSALFALGFDRVQFSCVGTGTADGCRGPPAMEQQQQLYDSKYRTVQVT
jgi:hypothetical protein